MRILPFCPGAIPVLLISLLIAVSFCYADDQKTVEVIGVSECADCQKNNIKHSDAFKGLRVTIDCKLANGEVKTRGEGKLDEEGKFKVDNFPHELVENGMKNKLKEECYAQLHSAANLPCPTHNANGIESTKLTFVSESNGKHTFSPVGKLKFSPSTCTSEFLWPYYKDPFHKKWPFTFPKIPFKKPFYYTPTYKKPYPHYYPIYKKPLTPVPVYTKPLPPPVPVYTKPYPPIYKKPDIPIYKKPYPPIYKKPYIPIYKKPCPPITIPKIDYPKFPPKIYYEHPKFKKWPFFPPKP